MRPLTKSILLLSAVLCTAAAPLSSEWSATPSHPAPKNVTQVTLSAASSSPGGLVALRALSGILSKHPGARLETGTASLVDGQPDAVIARISGPDTCDADGCLTVVLMQRDGRWVPVFQSNTQEIALTAPVVPKAAAGIPARPAYRDIVTNGGLVWDWDGIHGYVPELSSVAEMMKLPAALPKLPAGVRDIVARAWYMPSEEAAKPDAVWATPFPEVIPDAEVYLVQTFWGCAGGAMGCPAALVMRKPGQARWHVVLTTMVDVPMFALLPHTTNGIHDIGQQFPTSFTVYRWTGSEFRANISLGIPAEAD